MFEKSDVPSRKIIMKNIEKILSNNMGERMKFLLVFFIFSNNILVFRFFF